MIMIETIIYTNDKIAIKNTWYSKLVLDAMMAFVYIKILSLESLLDSREIKPVSPKGNQPWIVIGRIDAQTKAPIL